MSLSFVLLLAELLILDNFFSLFLRLLCIGRWLQYFDSKRLVQLHPLTLTRWKEHVPRFSFALCSGWIHFTCWKIFRHVKLTTLVKEVFLQKILYIPICTPIFILEIYNHMPMLEVCSEEKWKEKGRFWLLNPFKKGVFSLFSLIVLH